MTTESAVEALNMWIDVCISNGAGDCFSKALLLSQTPKTVPSPAVANNKADLALGNNDIVFEDANVKVVFVKWERKYYMFGGNARAATFIYINKTDHKIGFYMKGISVDGFTNQEKSMQKPIAGHKKGMEQIPFVYEDKVPGNVSDYKTVEFILCYGQVGEQYDHNFIGTIVESPEISLKL